MAALHAMWVTHNARKPASVLANGLDGRLRMVGFGLACTTAALTSTRCSWLMPPRDMAGEEANTVTLGGAPPCMAPEQLGTG